jgi:hypothetical protein
MIFPWRAVPLLLSGLGVFAASPLDGWLAEQDQAHFQWSAKALGGELTPSQRLGAHIDVSVDGNEVAKRRGRGELQMIVRLTTADHRVFESEGTIPLKDAKEDVSRSYVVYTQNALVVPGDYRVDIGMMDSETKEHATLTKTLHVGPLRSDPLPDSWRGVPAVEFVMEGDRPDVWYQPQLTGRLHLRLDTSRPVNVNVILNGAPSVVGARFRAGEATGRMMADLLPALKTISQVELSRGSINVSAIDVTRREVLYQQEKVDPLDWTRLRPALLGADPNKIDVRHLSDRSQNPQFFVEQVRRGVGSADALIVLTGVMAFDSGADRRPIEPSGKPGAKVFYIRFHPEPLRYQSDEVGLSGRRSRRGGGRDNRLALVTQEAPDALEPLLKPLQPDVFDVYSPIQFRRALAEIIKEIAKL